MKILATLPTYNEAGNILLLIDELLSTDDRLQVLVVDDDSPDGTWQLVQELASENPRVHLIHRTEERGRGTAGQAAFIYARDNGYDVAVEMDADYSHHPRFIPELIMPLETDEADIVVGSRLVPGGSETGRHGARRLITLGANFYIRIMLRLPVRDCTTGYRTYNRRALEAIPWERLSARGPEIVQEVLIAARRENLRITERPILFEERRAGESTFNWHIAVRSLRYVWKNRAW